MKKIVIEYIDNDDKIFWINEQKISNIHEGRIYPTKVSDIITLKSVAIYSVSDVGNKVQIAQLACVDYELLKKKYNSGEVINLNYCYIDDFSWYGTNKLYEVDETNFREILGITACCSFWNADNSEDNLVTLMQLNVINSDVEFNYSIFYKTRFCLTNINILKGSLWFDYAKFWGVDVSLMSVSCNKTNYFNQMVSFNYTEFSNSSIDFMLMKNNVDISFLLTKMSNTKVDINNAMNNIGNICLTRSIIDKFEISHCKVDGIDARECQVSLLCFKGCVLEGLCEIELKTRSEIFFESCILNSTLKLDSLIEPQTISFENTVNNGRIFFNNFQKMYNAILESVNESKDINQLLMLKENFRSIGEYTNEDICYSKYRAIQNKLYEKNKFKKFGNFLTSWISDYGTKPARVFLFIIILILGFSIFYYLCPLISFSNMDSFIDYIYISGITFFTVGYGDILPLNSTTKLAVLAEAFLGVATMSYFLVILSRKIIR